MKIVCHTFAAFLLFVMPSEAAPVQQSSGPPAQQRTGRSYNSRDPAKKPPPAVPQAPSPVTFTDVTQASGIAFRHAASPTSQKYLLETMGGGGAMLDYDNDGRLDLYFASGAQLADPMPKAAMPDKQDSRYWNRLYHQKQDGAFEDVTER